MIRSYVSCQLRSEFYHRYKDAPEEVWYLRNIHRHELHIEVKMEVFDDDREVEFIMLKHKIEQFIKLMNLTDPNGKYEGSSCESLASTIIAYLICEYGENRNYQVTIKEDGENGATVIYKEDK